MQVMKKTKLTLMVLLMINAIVFCVGSICTAAEESHQYCDIKNGRFYPKDLEFYQYLDTSIRTSTSAGKCQLERENDYLKEYSFTVNNQKSPVKAFILDQENDSFGKFTLDFSYATAEEMEDYGWQIIITMIGFSGPEDAPFEELKNVFTTITDNPGQVYEYENVSYVLILNDDVCAFRMWPSDRTDNYDSETANKDPEIIDATQNLLNYFGYDCGTPDGVAGEKTKNAIKHFQIDHGLDVTGTITGELCDAFDADFELVKSLERDLSKVVDAAKKTSAGSGFTYLGPVTENTLTGYNIQRNGSVFFVLHNTLENNVDRIGIIFNKLSSETGQDDMLDLMIAILCGIAPSISETRARTECLDVFNRDNMTLTTNGITIVTDTSGIYFSY